MKQILSFSVMLAVNLSFGQENPLFSEKGSAAGQGLLVTENFLFEEVQKGNEELSGTVINAQSREPIAGAKVSVLGTARTAVTAADGQYKIVSIAKGYYQIKAEADGYDPDIKNNVGVGYGSDIIFFELWKKGATPPPDFVEVEKQPKPIEGTTAWPKYPEQARKEGMEGTVWVKVWIDEKGNAREVHVTKSDAEIFNQATIDAALQWKFDPAILKGKPVAVWVTIPFKFKLDPDSMPAEKLDKQPDPKKTVTPKYPESARKLNLTGKFFLKVTIDEKGNVLNTAVDRYDITDHNESTVQHLSQEEKKKRSEEVNSSIEEMKDQAQQAIKQWKFSPGMKDGKAVKVKVTIPVNYSLNDTKGEKKK